jgi:hypothetical protein
VVIHAQQNRDVLMQALLPSPLSPVFGVSRLEECNLAAGRSMLKCACRCRKPGRTHPQPVSAMGPAESEGGLGRV